MRMLRNGVEALLSYDPEKPRDIWFIENVANSELFWSNLDGVDWWVRVWEAGLGSIVTAEVD